jgi:DNA-nicking Smr family endonuclease
MTDSHDDDIEHFRKAMQSVRRITAPKVNIPSKKIPAKKIINRTETHQYLKDDLSNHVIETVTRDEKIFFARAGVQPKFLRDLRQGKNKISASLDLHGMTIDQARQALTRFINTSLQQEHRCVRIVHGKGRDTPILKNQVNTWLKQIDAVLAFCSALPHDGGAGALYVRLRRNI